MITSHNETIAILGISDNPMRYSFKAAKMLIETGYKNILGINPQKPTLEGVKIFSLLNEIKDEIHTITIYINQNILKNYIDDIISIKPKRIILNPGTECDFLIKKAKEHDIEIMKACTLVLLSSNQF